MKLIANIFQSYHLSTLPIRYSLSTITFQMPIPQMRRAGETNHSPKNIERYQKEKHQTISEPSKEKSFSQEGKEPKKIKKTLSFKTHKVLQFLISAVIVLIFVGTISFVGVIAYFSKDLPDPNKLIDRTVAESTKIYDRKGETLLYEIHGDQKRTSVELSDISQYVKWATLSAEDKHFYEHHGINVFSIIQAVVIDPLLGKGIRGGSTLTQQFVKNAILTNEKRVSRKIKEWILSYQIEKKFSKDQILKMYFNEIPYGSVVYGVEAASQYFFNKSAKDLTLAESAVIAGIPQAPTRLSPFGSHLDQLFARQRWILDEMVDQGYITKDEAEKAKTEEIKFAERNAEDTGMIAPHFVMYIKELLAEKFGDKAVEQGGMKVITTLDLDKQKIAEDIIKEKAEKNLEWEATNAALVSIDAKTGQILAMVGSKDFFNKEIDGQVNVAIRPRQPGSSIKPMAYASAIEKGFTTETILWDVKTVFPTATGPYSPLNYNLKENGPVTMRKALAGSLNIPAVKTLYLAGVEYVKGNLMKLGYSTINEKTQCGLSLVLGGCEVTLLDHTAAYTALARDGERSFSAAILKITDKDGKTLEEFEKRTEKVFSENTARSIDSIMSDNNARAYIFGTNNSLTLPGRPVAAKTGTTNDFKDAWAIGFTPSIVTGVWVGNNNGKEMKTGADGSMIAAPIWQAYMTAILKDQPVESFKEPAGLADSLKPILRGQMSPETEVEIDKATGKLATAYTPPSYREKKKFREVHDTLYYVNKDFPNGPAPENPAQEDPMFTPWETGVQNWIKAQVDKAKAEGKTSEWDIVNQQPPTEFDDLHTEANRPTLTILSPNSNQLIETNPVNFSANASAPRGIFRIEFELDGQIVGLATASPYSVSTYLSNFSAGYHTLKVTAYDDIDNFNSTEIEINLRLPVVPANLEWLNPQTNSTFKLSNFPLTITAKMISPENIEHITFYAQKKGDSYSKMISRAAVATSEAFSITWTKTDLVGEYQVYGVLLDKNGSTSNSSILTLNITE